MKRLLAVLLFCLLPSLAQAATCTSYPFTLQNNTTADATQVMSNFNTVRNCVVNNAAGSGVNSDITSILGLTVPLSPAQGGSSVFIGGTSTGSANAQVVAATTPANFSLTSGYRVTFTVGFTNSGATTLNINSTGATVVNRVGNAGLEVLTGGELVAGNIAEAIYNGSVLVLLTSDMSDIGQRVSIGAAATTDLGTVATHNAAITGSGATITSFGSTAVSTNPIYRISFAGANTLTHNATSLIIPGAANITTALNDTAVVEYLGSGNWQVLSYTRASGAPVIPILPVPGGYRNLSVKVATNTTVAVAADFVTLYDGTNTVTVAQSSTVDLGSAGGVNKLDTGTIAIDSWYAIWVIYNGTTVGGLASLSGTAPTMPAGYTFKARVGWVRTIHATATLYGTWQFNRSAQYVVGLAQTSLIPNVANGVAGTFSQTSPTLTTISLSSVVPTTASKVSLFVSNGWATGGTANVLVAPNTSYGGANRGPLGSAGNAYPLYLNNNVSVVQNATFTLEAATIAWASDAGGGAVGVAGWEDNL